MPLWLVQTSLAVAILVTAASGVWLMINARAVARLFRGTGEIDPGPGPRRASRGTVWAVIVAFNLGWIASVSIWSWAMDSDNVVETPRQ